MNNRRGRGDARLRPFLDEAWISPTGASRTEKMEWFLQEKEGRVIGARVGVLAEQNHPISPTRRVRARWKPSGCSTSCGSHSCLHGHGELALTGPRLGAQRKAGAGISGSSKPQLLPNASRFSPRRLQVPCNPHSPCNSCIFPCSPFD